MAAIQIEVSPGVLRWFDIDAGDGLLSTTPIKTRFATQSQNVGTSVTTNTTLLSLSSMNRCALVAVQISNTGAAAFSALSIETKPHPATSWVVRLNASSHFLSPPSQSILRVCSGVSGAAIDPTTLAAGSIADFVLDLTTFICSDLRIVASSSGTTATTSVLGEGY